MEAALNNDSELVNFLQDRGAKFNSPDEELLSFAASGDVPGIRRVLAAGAHVNRSFGSEYVTPLMVASVNGQTLAVKLLIAHRANINAYDETHDTPLMYAIKSRHSSTVLALLDGGANPKLDNVAQVTTLHQSAIYMDDPEIVHCLIAHGVSPAGGDSISVTPLMNAAEFGHYETVKILLDAHVPVNVQSQEGRTALIDAATSGRADIVTLLLRAGADPFIRDKQNRTALDNARQMHEEKVIAILGKNPPESLTAPSNQHQ
jgi:ankyrin repeat protein